jgi:hypothetical protein
MNINNFTNLNQKILRSRVTISLFVIFFFQIQITMAQVTLSGAINNTYANLTAAFNAINTTGGSGSITVNLTSSFTQTTTASLNQTNYTITITANTNVIVSGAINLPLIQINGADNITINGTANKYIAFRNTNIGGTASALNITNDADNNTITNCIFEGSTKGTFNNGVVNILGNTGSSGCDNNIFSKNDVKDSSGGIPQNGITIEGNVSSPNENNQIIDNNISNFFNPTGFSVGIYSYRYNKNMTISGNSFFQTATRLATSNNQTNNIVEIDDGFYANTGSVNIVNNFFGGTGTQQGGTPYTVTRSGTGSAYVTPIFIYGSNLHNNNISGNKIGNIVLNNTFNNTTSWFTFTGINIQGGKVKVENNTIGNTSDNGSITVNTTLASTGSLVTAGIYNGSTNSVLISNNTVKSITKNITTAISTASAKVWGIYSYRTDSCAISNNTIGSATIPQSIKINNTTAFTQLWGIGTEDSNISILNNTIKNLSSESLGGDFTGIGIWNFLGGKTYNCTSNTISDFSSTLTSQLFMKGISVYNAAASSVACTVNIDNNIIKNFSSNTVSSSINMAGVLVTQNNGAATSAVNGTINSNLIENFSNTNNVPSATVVGIFHDQGHNIGLDVNNNIIRNMTASVADMTGVSIQTKTIAQVSAGLTKIKNNTIYNIVCNYTGSSAAHSAIDVDLKNGIISKNTIYGINAPFVGNSTIAGIQLYFTGTQTMKVENNMITVGEVVSNNIPIYGISISNQATPIAGQVHIDYNSVLVSGSGLVAVSAAVYRGNATVVNSLKNNILYNSRDGANNYSIAVPFNTGWIGTNSNNNYFVSTVAPSLCLLGSNDMDLAAWQTATSGDANSITQNTGGVKPPTNSNGLFIQPNIANLSINTANAQEATFCQNQAVPILGITDDYFGTTRNTFNPDIGANEYDCVTSNVLPNPNAGSQLCKFITVPANTTQNFYDSNCKIIASVTSNGASPVAGNISSCVKIESSTPTYNSKPYLKRHYDIEPSVNAANATATVKLYFLQSEFDAYNTYITTNGLGLPLLPSGGVDNGNFRITQCHGTGTAPGNYTGASVLITPVLTWIGINNWWEVDFPVVGFSGFFAHSGASILPVRLVDFKGIQNGKTNLLEWKTSLETNFAFFEIEKSKNGINDWSKLGEKQAKGINNGNGISRYEIEDESPFSISYYRLKMIDKDSSFEYSKTIVLSQKNQKLELLSLFPNPSNAQINLQIYSPQNGEIQISIKDLNGRIIAFFNKNITEGENRSSQDISNLPNGIYFLQLKNDSETVVQKFIKN